MGEANYFQKVYYVTRRIPRGRVTNYGAIADYLALGSARMVGWALNNNSLSEHGVPAHRVINRKGELSGRNHFPTPTMMQELLENEGVEVINNKVSRFTEHFWHPGEHLPPVDEIKSFDL
jgi:methylated-DNA-protein-cysteine methyltransferase-like protein